MTAINKKEKLMKSIIWRHEIWLVNYVRLNFPVLIRRWNFITAIVSGGYWHGDWIFLRRFMLQQLRLVCLCGIFKRFRKIAKKEYLASSCLSVRLSAWNNSAHTGRNFVKFGASISRKFVEKIQVSSEYYKHNGHCTWKPMHIYVHISLNSFSNEKYFSQT